MDREFIEDPIERALVWSESNDQLESECIGSKDPVIARGGRDSIIHVGNGALLLNPLSRVPLSHSFLKSNHQFEKESFYLLSSTTIGSERDGECV